MRFNLLVQKDDPLAVFSLPPSLVVNLQQAAKKSRRKLTTEIIIRLARTFDFDSHYQLLAPLIRLDYLGQYEFTLATFKTFKAESLQKSIDDQLKALRLYFQKRDNFKHFEQAFPKELWQALQLSLLKTGQAMEESMSIRLTATLQEPKLFNLPTSLVNNSCKG